MAVSEQEKAEEARKKHIEKMSKDARAKELESRKSYAAAQAKLTPVIKAAA